MEKRSESPFTTTRDIGRALPTIPTNRPTSALRPELSTSSHDGRAPSGVVIVMSQRPTSLSSGAVGGGVFTVPAFGAAENSAAITKAMNLLII